jgi:hypothetical protein
MGAWEHEGSECEGKCDRRCDEGFAEIEDAFDVGATGDVENVFDVGAAGDVGWGMGDGRYGIGDGG